MRVEAKLEELGLTLPEAPKLNGFSDLILELYGPESGMHARMAPGLATLPLGVPVTISAEVAISS
jgi:hypothetical protein